MVDYEESPIKQNQKIKQFIGWFMAILFPFTAKGVIAITNMPIISALIYWSICGVLLKTIIDKKLPYFNAHFSKIKKELTILIALTLLYLLLYSINLNTLSLKSLNLIVFLYVVFSGILEPLIGINICELAGCRVKLVGIIAACIHGVFMQIILLGALMPAVLYSPFFWIFQISIYINVFIIYIKTSDITIWSCQHIVFNLITIILWGLGPAALLNS
ncbi:MAG: hypothetical protein Q8936_08785 [Bacillota bacterium]|nr:hypothetical protein [Bacillota bacterium]